MLLLSTVLVLAVVAKNSFTEEGEGGGRAEAGSGARGGGVTFDEFIDGEFSAEFFNGSWWSADQLQWKDEVVVLDSFTKNILSLPT